MTGRERVLQILNRQTVDRPAFGLGGTDCSSVHVLAYAKLRRHLGYAEKPIRCGCLSQLIAEPDGDIQDAFGLDAESLLFGSRETKLWHAPISTTSSMTYRPRTSSPCGTSSEKKPQTARNPGAEKSCGLPS